MRITYLAAPALMIAYGFVRLIDGIDGEHGPGPAWTIGHLFFLAALVMFVPVLLKLRQMAGGAAAGISAVLGIAGLVTFIRVAIIDIIAGLKASDHAEKSVLSDRYENDPTILPSIVYEIGPLFFQLGLIALLIQLAIARKLPVWSPVLVFAGMGLLLVNLDLLPIGAALILVALLPVAKERTPQVHPVSLR